MRDESAFLQTIAAAPDDDAPRLVYADWLAERGDPRGAFVRLQCALAALPPDDPLRSDLEQAERRRLAAHAADWTADLAGRVSGWQFCRGFVEEITLSAAAFLEYGADLLRPGLIRTVQSEHPARITQLRRHVPDQPIPDLVLVPDRGVQQPLHPQRRAIPGELRDRPPVRPVQPRHQPQQIPLRPQPRLPPPERRRHHPVEHVIKTIQPPGRINLPYPGHDGRRAINQCSHSQMITKRPSPCHDATPELPNELMLPY